MLINGFSHKQDAHTTAQIKPSIANIKKFVMVVTEIDKQSASVSSSEEIVMMPHTPTVLCTTSFREKNNNNKKMFCLKLTVLDCAWLLKLIMPRATFQFNTSLIFNLLQSHNHY